MFFTDRAAVEYGLLVLPFPPLHSSTREGLKLEHREKLAKVRAIDGAPFSVVP